VLGVSGHPPLANQRSIPWVCTDMSGDFEARLESNLPIHGVVHLAAAPACSPLAELRSVNMEASERLFRYCGMNDVEKVIFLSGVSVLARPLRCPISEAHAVGPVLPYHLSKYWGEVALKAAADEHGYVGVTLRTSSPVCKDFDLLPPTVLRKWLALAGDGFPLGLWGTGNRTQDFVAVEDIGQAVVQTLERVSSSDLVHVGSGRQTSMRELAEAIASAANVPVEVTHATDPNEADRWDLDLTHAREVLGYVPRFTIFDYLGELVEQASCAVR
jgi:UDP-glucose 4-epimerase